MSLKILAHPATKVAGAILILAGIGLMATASLGIAGIVAGLTLLTSTMMVGAFSGGAALLSSFGMFTKPPAEAS